MHECEGVCEGVSMCAHECTRCGPSNEEKFNISSYISGCLSLLIN